jgi:hypothetical protein
LVQYSRRRLGDFGYRIIRISVISYITKFKHDATNICQLLPNYTLFYAAIYHENYPNV